VLVFSLAAVAIFEKPLMSAEQVIRFLFPIELFVRIALLLLVLVLLYVPIAWLFQFSRLSSLVFLQTDTLEDLPPHLRHQLKQKDFAARVTEARAEFLGWLTAISVPYLILGFSMTIEFQALLEEPTRGVGAIAAIMVLYALSVLSSFLYIEVRDLRKGFSDEMRTTGEWLGYSFALANYQTPIGTPAQNVSTLLEGWIELLGRSSATQKNTLEIRQNLLGTLLASYIKEESENICGRLSPDRTPVWVKEVQRAAQEKEYEGGIAFLATNVGFYANYLSTAVKGLAHSLSKDQCVVLATVTYVLPSFWWNWPYANEHHGMYEPIESFRNTLVKLAEEDASNGKSLRVFRRMLVRKTDPKKQPGKTTKLADKTLNDVFVSTFATDEDWNQMKNWKILKEINGRPLTSRDRSPVNLDQLAAPIRWTGGNILKDDDLSHVYWMCEGNAPANIPSELISSYYKHMMHPAGGGSQICGIDFEAFQAPFGLDPTNQSVGLSGCPEITFIGVCDSHCDNVWTSKPSLGLAFLSNMTKGHDSIFLAVVVAEPLIENLWSSVCATLNPRVIDEL